MKNIQPNGSGDTDLPRRGVDVTLDEQTVAGISVDNKGGTQEDTGERAARGELSQTCDSSSLRRRIQ